MIRNIFDLIDVLEQAREALFAEPPLTELDRQRLEARLNQAIEWITDPRVDELETELENLREIPAEVIESARNLENAGGDAQALAQFVLELGVRT